MIQLNLESAKNEKSTQNVSISVRKSPSMAMHWDFDKRVIFKEKYLTFARGMHVTGTPICVFLGMCLMNCLYMHGYARDWLYVWSYAWL